MLKSMHARRGISRNSASTNSLGSTRQEDECKVPGIVEGMLLLF